MGVEEKIRQLPPELHKGGEDYVDFLLQLEKKKGGKKLKLDWISELREYRDKYLSLSSRRRRLNGGIEGQSMKPSTEVTTVRLLFRSMNGARA